MVFSEWMYRVLRGVWWVSVVWLAIATVFILLYFTRWFTEVRNPSRYEYAIAALVIFFYSLPAAVGVLLSGMVPKTGLSNYRRIGGVALLVFCIIALLTLDFLQARNR